MTSSGSSAASFVGRQDAILTAAAAAAVHGACAKLSFGSDILLHSWPRAACLPAACRYERSGTMHGLFRVRGFTQDDAHIFCLPEQIEPEIRGVLDLVQVGRGC